MTEFSYDEANTPPQEGFSYEDAMKPPRQQQTRLPDIAFLDATKPMIEPIVNAFGQGFREGFGPERMGLSDQSVKELQDMGLFRKERSFEPFKAMNELLMDTMWRTGEVIFRGGSGLFRGTQAAAVAAGLPRDIAAMPEAFFGSPHPLGIPKTLPEVPVRPAEVAKEGAGKSFEIFVKDTGEIVDTGMTQADAFRTIAGDEQYGMREGKGPPISLEDTVGGLPEPPKPNLVEASELGVIGPEPPRIGDAPPKEAAERAVPAARPDEKVTQEVGGGNPWRERFDQFVSKIDKPEDIQRLIRDAADEQGEFPAAREGNIPLKHVESVAEAAGVAADTVDARGLGRTLRNDAEVRIGMRLMLQATENVKTAARDLKADGSPESMIKMQEAIMRRDLAVEQIVGLRAEWGRTGNVFQEFLRDVKDQESLSNFLKDKGRSAGDLHEIAAAIDTLDNAQAARVLSDMRSRTPTPFYWVWVQGLISGLLTHTKYVAANAVFAASEHGVTTPIAAMIGKAKQLFGADVERVYFGETAAATWGLIAATPYSFMATARSIRAGLRAPLKSGIELHRIAVERGDKVPPMIDRAVNQVFGMGRPTEKLFGVVPLDGIWGRILGAPGDAAMGIHTFFKIIGERAGLEAEAYRAAAKEGLNPTEGDFWRRRAEHSENPTEAMRERAVAGAYKGTFMGELGPHGRRWQQFTKETPGLKWIFPFSHIPVNLLKSTYEHTPLAVLDAEMRADITGKNGGIAQDKAISRMVVGSAIMGYFVNSALNGRATGNLPRDPKERDSWKLQNKQPNSILINNTWVSYSKFGPAGSLANLAANLAQVIPHLTSHDDDGMTKATWELAHAASKMVIEEVGFMSLAMLFEGLHDDKKGVSIIASQAASAVPFSSFLAQTASGGIPGIGGGDPHMREVKSFIDGIKYKIPFARETLPLKRDWSGQPIANPQYGNILRQRTVNNDPVDLEMDRLQIHPAPPINRIGGVQLPPKLYDQYQVMAGAYTRTALEHWVKQPEWSSLPAFTREQVFRNTIKTAHEAARANMQAQYPQIIQQGIDNKVNHILGEKQQKKLPEPVQ